ncbi:hypothetical protein [Desulfotruncus arcticus]|uniref:hypothetical protein n=1 Tax=Desulfotruncus arcticus TaxID=341036 RepID=UPI0013F4E4D1|nr:hypothetical protein [Desulfotruncus arcticus]
MKQTSVATLTILTIGGLIKMIKQRIADPVIIKMIGKWLKAGVMQNRSSLAQ